MENNSNRSKKMEIMKELIDRYEQIRFVEYPCTEMILDNYIQKLENKLKGML